MLRAPVTGPTRCAASERPYCDDGEFCGVVRPLRRCDHRPDGGDQRGCGHQIPISDEGCPRISLARAHARAPAPAPPVRPVPPTHSPNAS
eukprot:7380084-Prymnesium_polylepis.1